MSLEEKIEIVALSDTGRVRQNNEDSIGSQPLNGLVVLADGMGGHKGGEVASSICVNTILSQLEERLERNDLETQTINETGYSNESLLIQHAIEHANEVVHQTAQSQPQYQGMGTTVVVLKFYDNRVSIAHIGDSRCYRYRDHSMEQITKDHTLLQELVDRGFYTPEEARKSLNKNLVTRALGIDPIASPDISEEIALTGDIFLLCSDGLTDMLTDEQISLTLEEYSDTLEEAAKQLITKANQNGGKDNVSVILCKILSEFPTRSNWLSRLMNWFD